MSESAEYSKKKEKHSITIKFNDTIYYKNIVGYDNLMACF